MCVKLIYCLTVKYDGALNTVYNMKSDHAGSSSQFRRKVYAKRDVCCTVQRTACDVYDTHGFSTKNVLCWCEDVRKINSASLFYTRHTWKKNNQCITLLWNDLNTDLFTIDKYKNERDSFTFNFLISYRQLHSHILISNSVTIDDIMRMH